MVYIHKETYDIFKSVVSPFEPLDTMYFRVDELIALPIQALNRKGYITEFSCSGHPFSEMALPKEFFGKMKEDSNRSYIIFKEGISIPYLPTGFKRSEQKTDLIQDNRLIIEYFYDDKPVYDFYLDIIKKMEELYIWALDLPLH